MADKLYVDIDKAVGLGYLSDWYQNSIDDTISPIWTDEHLMELLNDFLVIPNDTPTADVKEVKRGKWYRHNKKEHGDTCYYCSVCEKMALSDCMEWELTKYCPNCGADMRKPKNDKE